MLEHISIFQFQVLKHFFISVHFTFLFYFLHNIIIHFFLRYTGMSFEDPTFSDLRISNLEIRTNRSSNVHKLRRMHMRYALRFFLSLTDI